MKRIIFCSIILCVLLCGCGNDVVSTDSDENDIETIQNSNSEESTENISEEETKPSESTTERMETEEEFVERMESIYLEIKDEATRIGAQKSEILFNEIPWGSNFNDANDILQSKDGFPQTLIMLNVSKSINSMLGIWIEFDERFNNLLNSNNISGMVWSSNKELKVAGYNVDNFTLLFSAIKKGDEYILSNEDSALYAAQYTIKPVDSKSAKEDFKEKISSIYGEFDAVKEIEPLPNDSMAFEYIYWYGANDTVLVLTVNNGGTITISYVWLGGEDLLNAALDNAEKKQKEDAESVYGDGNTDGL